MSGEDSSVSAWVHSGLHLLVARAPIDEIIDLTEQFANAFFDEPTNITRS